MQCKVTLPTKPQKGGFIYFCIRGHGHTGPHRDMIGRRWPRPNAEAVVRGDEALEGGK